MYINIYILPDYLSRSYEQYTAHNQHPYRGADDFLTIFLHFTLLFVARIDSQ